MKRLTIRNSDGTVSQPTTTSIEALFYRLAAYEDTGLEPEEIIRLYKENAELINATMVLRKTNNQKKQTIIYEMEYNAELSHENLRTIAKIVFDNLMKADLKHQMSDIISDDYDLDRLRELAEADKEGRCVVLPCKVGDTVWFIKSAFSMAHFPIEAKYVSLRGLSTDGDVWLSAITSYNKISRSFYGSDIGKTVFLTREAAEAALKEREQNE